MATPVLHRIFLPAPDLQVPTGSTRNMSTVESLIDPSLQARSLEILRGTQSTPPMASHITMSNSQRLTHQLLSPNDLKLSPSDDSDPPNDKPEELSLVGPFREKSLDRPMRLMELKELRKIFKSGAPSFEERIEAIDEAINLTKGADAKQSIQSLLDLVMNPEAGLTFTFREALSEEWRFHNHVRISLLWMHGLSAILRLLKRGEIEDRKTILKQVILISLNHPWDVTLVHLGEDWPADDPHRVAPYLIDPDRPQRLLLGVLIDRLTDGLEYDPRSNEDHELYNETSRARQYLRRNELAIRNYLAKYDPKPYQPARFAWLRNLLVPSSRRNRRGRRFAAVLNQYCHLFLRLPGPEILFPANPFAYKRSIAPKRLEPATKEPSSEKKNPSESQ